ncbi:hypothetical protein FA95DRAFT_1576901, partial [Auriscalpium vulgare]
STDPPRSFTRDRTADLAAQTAAWHKVGAARPTRVKSNEIADDVWLASSNADWIPPYPDTFPPFVTERSDGLRGHHEPTRVPQHYDDARPWLAYMWSLDVGDPARLSLVRDKGCYTERWTPEPRRVAVRSDTAQLLIDEYEGALALAEEVDIRLLDNQHRIPSDLRLSNEVFTELRYGRSDLHATLVNCATVQRATIELRGFALWANYTLAFRAGFITAQETLLPVVGCWVRASDTHIWETLTYGGVPCWRMTPTPPKDPAAYHMLIGTVPSDLALDDWDEDIHHPRPEHTYGRKERNARAAIAKLEAAGKHYDAMEVQDALDGISQDITWDERVAARREMQARALPSGGPPGMLALALSPRLLQSAEPSLSGSGRGPLARRPAAQPLPPSVGDRSVSPPVDAVSLPAASSPGSPMAMSPAVVPAAPPLTIEPLALALGTAPTTPTLHEVVLSGSQQVRTWLALSVEEARNYVRVGWWEDTRLVAPLAPWELQASTPPYMPDQYQYPVPPASCLEQDRALYVWRSISPNYIDTIVNVPPTHWAGGRVKEWKSRLRPKGSASRALRNLPSLSPTWEDVDGVLDVSGQPWVVLDAEARAGLRWAARTFLFRRDVERLVLARLPGAPLWPAHHALFTSVRARMRRIWGSASAFYPEVGEPRYLDSDDELVRLRHWRAFGALLADLAGVNGPTIEAAMGGPVTDMPDILLRLFTSYFRETFDRDPTVLRIR